MCQKICYTIAISIMLIFALLSASVLVISVYASSIINNIDLDNINCTSNEDIILQICGSNDICKMVFSSVGLIITDSSANQTISIENQCSSQIDYYREIVLLYQREVLNNLVWIIILSALLVVLFMLAILITLVRCLCSF
jgi:hypothetical protein